MRWWYFPQQYGDYGMEPLLQARAGNAEVSDVLPAAPPAQAAIAAPTQSSHRPEKKSGAGRKRKPLTKKQKQKRKEKRRRESVDLGKRKELTWSQKKKKKRRKIDTT